MAMFNDFHREDEVLISYYPLVNCPITMENHHFSWENHHFSWENPTISIAMASIAKS